MVSTCRLDPGQLVAYRDGTLPPGRREVVEAHLQACPACQERVAAFEEVDRMLQTQATVPPFPVHRRDELLRRLRRESAVPSGVRRYLRWRPPSRPLARLIVSLLVLLAVVPAATQAGFPIGRFVRFAEVELTHVLPREAQRPIHHAAPSDSTTTPSFRAVAPAELPLGLTRVERAHPSATRVEVLYRNLGDVAILITQHPADAGRVTLEATDVEVSTVRGTQVLALKDPRPHAVSALFWERGGVVFEMLVIASPRGPDGGLKHDDALQVVQAVMTAQDTVQE